MGQIISAFSDVDNQEYSVWRHDRVAKPNLKLIGNFKGKNNAYQGLMEYIIENDAERIIEGLVDACVLTSEDTFDIRPEIAKHYTVDELNLFDIDADDGQDAIYARKIWDMLKPEHKQLFYEAFVGEDDKEPSYDLFYSLKVEKKEDGKEVEEKEDQHVDEVIKEEKDEKNTEVSQGHLGYLYSWLPFTSTAVVEDSTMSEEKNETTEDECL